MSSVASGQADPLFDRLDRLTKLLELALAPQLEAARAAARQDPIDAAILGAGDARWKSAAKLLAEVEAETGKKKSMIHNHISHLLERGFLEKQGGGPTTEYRACEVL